MEKKSSALSQPEKQIPRSAESTFDSPLSNDQKRVLARLRKRQQAGEPVNYGDAPPRPPGPPHPVAILRTRMMRRKMSKKEMADALHVPLAQFDAILYLDSGMTADMAVRLARYFGDTPQFWMDLQTQYDLAHVDQEAIAREVLPAAS